MVVQVAGLLSHHGHLLLGKGLESLQAVGFTSAQTENSQERAGTLCCLDRASHASKGARYQLLLFMRDFQGAEAKARRQPARVPHQVKAELANV